MHFLASVYNPETMEIKFNVFLKHRKHLSLCYLGVEGLTCDNLTWVNIQTALDYPYIKNVYQIV